jgi:hypothetical protein
MCLCVYDIHCDIHRKYHSRSFDEIINHIDMFHLDPYIQTYRKASACRALRMLVITPSLD